MVLTLAAPQDALDARLTDPIRTVYVGGVTVATTGVTHRHRVGETATGRLSMLLPRPASVVANAAVEVQGGHNDFVATQFSGFIPNWEGSMTRRGNLLDVTVVGWSELLKEPLRDDLTFYGPIAADAVFVALCQLVGVPSYLAEVATYSDNVTPLTLGGNSAITEGAVVIKALQSPLSQFQRLIEPYRYHVTDYPNGAVVMHRVGGLPVGDTVATFDEGMHFGTVRRGYDASDIVNVWDINGATYEDVYGGRVPIRSIADPESVPPHAEIREGYRYRRIANSDIVRQDQADAVRNWHEIDYSTATAPVSWDGVAVPGIDPGDCVAVESTTVEASGRLWLMGVEIDNDESGYTAGYEGWSGAGVELPGIVDRTETSIQVAAVHLGNEYVAWYAHPAHEGTEKTWNFTLPDKVSVANVRGWHHSTNSQYVGGEYTDLTVTRWEVWLAGVNRADKDNRPESSGTMPRLSEDYALRRPYASGLTWWSRFAVNLNTLDAGDYVLVLKAGDAEGIDDFEVQLVVLELFGVIEAAGYREAP